MSHVTAVVLIVPASEEDSEDVPSPALAALQAWLRHADVGQPVPVDQLFGGRKHPRHRVLGRRLQSSGRRALRRGLHGTGVAAPQAGRAGPDGGRRAGQGGETRTNPLNAATSTDVHRPVIVINMGAPGSRLYAGSRMHVLDWVEGRGCDFLRSLNAMLRPVGAVVLAEGPWRPTGYGDASEARLDLPCEPLLPPDVSSRLRAWWLAAPEAPRGNAPNWDLAAAALFPGGRRGLVLVEAKAHAGELDGEAGGKRLDPGASTNSVANHARIGAAIAEARDALGGPAAGVCIGRDCRYQFSNRVAFAWKLAAEGIPTALIYLGFVGDEIIGRLSAPIRDDPHWHSLVTEHAAPVLPAGMWEREIAVGGTPLWLLVRSLAVQRQSPERRIRTRRPHPPTRAA